MTLVEEAENSVSEAKTQHDATKNRLKNWEASEREKSRLVQRLQLQLERQQHNFELKNNTEAGEYRTATEEIARKIAVYTSEVQAKQAKVEALHGSDANEQRTQKMEGARNATIQAAQAASERCGAAQESQQEAIEVALNDPPPCAHPKPQRASQAWETRCLGSGTVWSGVSAGATHTCAIAKKSKSDESGAMCCWGGMARYDAYGRFDVLQKGTDYEYHLSAEDAEENGYIDPLAIVHANHDATPDTLVCDSEEAPAATCAQQSPALLDRERSLSNAGDLSSLCLGRFRGQKAVNVIGNPAHHWKEVCNRTGSSAERCSLHFATTSLRDTPNPLHLADKYTEATTERVGRPPGC